MTDLVRERYLSRIRPFYHQMDLIKVITGVRRSGKSVLLKQIYGEVLSSGRAVGGMAYLDLDDRKYRKVRTSDDLEAAIDAVLPSSGDGRYLFLDEVQNVDDFEVLVNGYRNEGVSVFITGSNSYLLSGEMVTKLTGRYMEFDVYPFSFSEVRDYCSVNSMDFDSRRDFNEYVRLGGFPRRFSLGDQTAQRDYVRSLIAEIIEKDVRRKRKVRNKATFERVLEYLLATPSATISSTSISDYLRSEHVNINPYTAARYIDLIIASRLVSKCTRTDLVGKKALKTLYKVYIADPALHTLYPEVRSDIRMGAMIENIVYNELRSRGYSVTVGKLRGLEIDFVVTDGVRRAFVQVTYVMESPDTEAREIAPLLKLKDASPKYIISLDPVTFDRSGVVHLHLIDDFLLGDGFELR